MSRSGGSTFKRCGCRDQRTGRQLGPRCPRLRKRGHGRWYLAIELSAAPDGRRRRVRLGGYATRAATAALGRLSTPGGQAMGLELPIFRCGRCPGRGALPQRGRLPTCVCGRGRLPSFAVTVAVGS
jgi:hypothetical protein